MRLLPGIATRSGPWLGSSLFLVAYGLDDSDLDCDSRVRLWFLPAAALSQDARAVVGAEVVQQNERFYELASLAPRSRRWQVGGLASTGLFPPSRSDIAGGGTETAPVDL